jgi:hypothetical protein
MPRRAESAGVSFSDDGSTAVFTLRRPQRGLGIFLACVPLLFIAMLVLVTWKFTGYLAGNLSWVPVLLGFVLAVTLVCLLPGLYFATRRGQASVNAREVIIESGSIYGRREERRPLSDFVGVERRTETVTTEDAGTVAGAALGVVAGLIAAAAGGGGAVVLFGKRVTVHSLSLVPRGGAGEEVLLVMDRDPAVIGAIQDELSRRFSLSVVVPSLEGLTVLRPGEIDRPLSERVAAEGAPARPLSAPPEPLQVEERPGRTTILFPQRPASLIAGACFSLLFMAMVVAGLAAGVDWPLLILPFGFAVGSALLGVFSYRRRPKVVLGSEGVHFEGVMLYPQLRHEMHVPWNQLRLVSVAAPTVYGVKGKPLLFVVSDAGDFYLAQPDLREEKSRWLAEAITECARRHAAPVKPGENDGAC